MSDDMYHMNPFSTRCIGWNKWAVVYKPKHSIRVRIVARFSGKFSRLRADQRCRLLFRRRMRQPLRIPTFETGIHHPAATGN
jgi:hypothetical protein